MAKHLRVVIVRPPVEVLHKFSKRFESLALGYLAAALRIDGHEAIMLDAQLLDLDIPETFSRIVELKPDIVAFTIVMNYFPTTLIELLAAIREAQLDAVVIVGGHSVSFFADRILSRLPRVDGVIIGEGELAIRGVARAICEGSDWRRVPGVAARGDDGGFIQELPERIHDLDALPMAARDLTSTVIELDGIPAISTSRGCYARCSFCSVPRFYGLHRGRSGASGGWLTRSPNSVIGEIDQLIQSFSLRELLFVDDEFFGGTEAGFHRARELAIMLKEHNWPISLALSCRAENAYPDVLERLQEGGLRHVFIGLEAGTERSLRLYGKRHSVEQNKRAVQVVKSLGLSFQTGFMMFNTYSTIQDVADNIAFLREIGEFKPLIMNSSMDPHFGTPVLLRLERDGALDDAGLHLSVKYDDPLVAAAKHVAEIVSISYEPFMNFLAGIRSSITFQWRRIVPNRTPEQERALDSFEEAVNCRFSTVVEKAVHRLLAPAPPADVVRDAEDELMDVVDDLKIAQGLLIAFLESTGDSLRYWSHKCLIRHYGSPTMEKPCPEYCH